MTLLNLEIDSYMRNLVMCPYKMYILESDYEENVKKVMRNIIDTMRKLDLLDDAT